jgi:hypothetical protein
MCLKRKDIKIKSWKNNFEFDNKVVYYCMMRYYDNDGDVGKYKNLFKNEEKLKEMLKIRLFDGLFKSSDNILRNILLLKDGKFLSIDEGDIFGKRTNIFNKTEWIKKSILCKNICNEIINEFLENIEDKKIKILEKLNMYNFSNKIVEFNERYDNYRNIVMSEFSV